MILILTLMDRIYLVSYSNHYGLGARTCAEISQTSTGGMYRMSPAQAQM